MAKRKRHPKWSLLLIRGPHRAVRQFHVSRTTVLALPAAAALTVVGCAVGLELRSQLRVQHLEEKLVRQSAELEGTVAAKDGEIEALNRELAQLRREADDFRRRMDQIHELEHKLKTFIDKYGQGVKLPAASGGGEVRTAAHASAPNAVVALAGGSAGEFAELSRLLDGLLLTIEAVERRAERERQVAESSPTGWPTVSRRLTSGFGYRKDPITGKSAFHAGIDIAGDVGDPVYAAGSGTVKETGFDASRGNYVVLSHLGGVESWYMHLSRIGVKEGAKVERGKPIGKLGDSGRSTGPHLHFQVVVRNEPVSPLKYLRLVKED